MEPRSLRRAVAFTSLLTLVAAVPGFSQEQEVPGPPHQTALTVGELPPTTFSLPTLDDGTLDLESLRGERALMIVFFRGTW